MKEYVLGFAFWRNHVALIWKTKGPQYVINTYNGIGGKVEAQDDGWIEGAMTREFAEETGLVISPDMWLHFATQNGTSWDGDKYKLHCLVTHLPKDEDFRNIENREGEGETVAWHSMLYEIPRLTPNLKWLLPLALDETAGFLDITEH